MRVLLLISHRFEIWRDMGRKSADFNLPHLYLARPYWGDLLGISHVWRQKSRVHGLSYGVVTVILRLAVWYNTALWQADRWPDRHTMTAYTALA